MSDKKLYKLDDHILFRKCDLYDGCDTQHGDCTNFKVKQVHCQDNYFCNQEGLHFHCARHPEIEYDNRSTLWAASSGIMTVSYSEPMDLWIVMA